MKWRRRMSACAFFFFAPLQSAAKRWPMRLSQAIGRSAFVFMRHSLLRAPKHPAPVQTRFCTPDVVVVETFGRRRRWLGAGNGSPARSQLGRPNYLGGKGFAARASCQWNIADARRCSAATSGQAGRQKARRRAGRVGEEGFRLCRARGAISANLRIRATRR